MSQGNRIWPSLPPASKDPSLRAGFGAAIQGGMDPCFGALPWIAASQALLAMTKGAMMKRGNDEKGKCDCPAQRGRLTGAEWRGHIGGTTPFSPT